MSGDPKLTLVQLLARIGLDRDVCSRLAAMVARVGSAPAVAAADGRMLRLVWPSRRVSAVLTIDSAQVSSPDEVLIGSLDVAEFERVLCAAAA